MEQSTPQWADLLWKRNCFFIITLAVVGTKQTTVSGPFVKRKLFRYNLSCRLVITLVVVGTKPTTVSGPFVKRKYLFHSNPSSCWNKAHHSEWTFREKEVVIHSNPGCCWNKAHHSEWTFQNGSSCFDLILAVVGTKPTTGSGGPFVKWKLLFRYNPSFCWNKAHNSEWSFLEKKIVVSL